MFPPIAREMKTAYISSLQRILLQAPFRAPRKRRMAVNPGQGRSHEKEDACLAMILSVAAILGGCGYNTMQQQEEKVFRPGGTWRPLQRRADLIPNLGRR